MGDLEVERFDEFLAKDLDDDTEHDPLDGPIICPNCTMHVEDIDDAYIEIFHSTFDDTDPLELRVNHQEFAHVVHAPSVINEPEQKWLPIDERIQNNCIPPKRNPINRHDRAENLSLIIFPVRAVTHVDNSSISWSVEGLYTVRYHLRQSGLPAWDDTVWAVRKLQRMAEEIR